MGHALTDSVNPEDYRYGGNSLFRDFNSAFIDAMLDLAKDDAFSECYCPSPMRDPSKLDGLLDRATAASDSLIGENESDLLRFAINDDIPFLTLVGHVGSGKSTIARSVARIINRHHLRSQVELQTINFNDKTSSINAARKRGADSLRNEIVKTIKDRVYITLGNQLRINNDPFWKYLSDHSTVFAKEMMLEANAVLQFPDDKSRADERVRAIRSEIIETDECLWEICRYSCDVLKQRYLIILDNVDRLHMDCIYELVLIAKELGESAKLRIVVPMRPETYNILCRRIDFLRLRRTSLQSPAIINVVAKRMDYIRELVIKESARRWPDDDATGRERRLDVLRSLDSAMSQLKPEIENMAADDKGKSIGRAIMSCTEDMRLGLGMVLDYFSSAYLDSCDILTGRLHDKNRVDVHSLPADALSLSVFTRNYKSMFDSTRRTTIINMLCDGTSMTPWSHFTYLMILQYLVGSRPEQRYSEVDTAFDSLRSISASAAVGLSADRIQQAVCVLVNCRVLSTPDTISIEFDDMLPNTSVKVTPLGNKYLTRIFCDPIYLGLVKDSARCETSDSAMHASFLPCWVDFEYFPRTINSLKFLHYLLSQEAIMINTLLGEKRDMRPIKLYASTFAARDANNGSFVSYSSLVVRAMTKSIFDRISELDQRGRVLPESQKKALFAIAGQCTDLCSELDGRVAIHLE